METVFVACQDSCQLDIHRCEQVFTRTENLPTICNGPMSTETKVPLLPKIELVDHLGNPVAVTAANVETLQLRIDKVRQGWRTHWPTVSPHFRTNGVWCLDFSYHECPGCRLAVRKYLRQFNFPIRVARTEDYSEGKGHEDVDSRDDELQVRADATYLEYLEDKKTSAQ